MTEYHAKYYSYYLSLKNPNYGPDRINSSLLNATIDLNPHQVEAALFYFKNSLSNGAILADEVGLGKTIEAGLILCQLWSEFKRKILLIVPASLRKQWKSELEEKFFLPTYILDGKTYKEYRKQGIKNPFDMDGIIICSYEFIAKNELDIIKTNYNLIVIDEAHKLRNAYKNNISRATTIRRIFENQKKLLLTATPLQNSLLELYGLVSFVDKYTFGDFESFKKQFQSPDRFKYEELKIRLKKLVNRTLRKQVLEYIPFTNRIAITQNFEPTDEEMELYEKLSGFLQKENIKVINSKTKHLVILILRKLLASSSYAISGTLDNIINRLETNSNIEDLVDDMDITQDYEEEIQEEDITQVADELKQLKQELLQLKIYRDLAKNIKIDSKTIALNKALNIAFNHEKIGNKKALIFTESRRTQEYLKNYLESNGYEGKIVIFNGSNNSRQTKEIYEKWLFKYSGTGKISGSKESDIRASLVEYFKDSAEIMIATESAAEGVNLQFCNLVINYDLPWNPQRIEQRIGRCHRYGQIYEVLVVNFLNTKNYADQRVYEILDKKFELFNGVFGSSDEVLGILDSGIDFEKKIFDIYQNSKTKEEIKSAFDNLQKEMESIISININKTKKDVLDNFDEDVLDRLKDIKDNEILKLDIYKKYFWNLSKFILKDYAKFDDMNKIFDLYKKPNENINLGKYSILKENIEKSIFYRSNDKLGEYVINSGKSLNLSQSKLVFYPKKYDSKISIMEEMIGKSGYLRVDKLCIESFDFEEYLIISCIDKNGNEISGEIMSKIFNIPGNIIGETEIENKYLNILQKIHEDEIAKTYEKSMNNNNQTFQDQITKLDLWEEDKKMELLNELENLKEEINIKRRESIRTADPNEKLKLRTQAAKLEEEQRKKQENYFKQVKEIQDQKWQLIIELEKRMQAGKKIENLFVIEWEIQ